MASSRSRGLLTGFAMVFATLLVTVAISFLNVQRLYRYDQIVEQTHEAGCDRIHALEREAFEASPVVSESRFVEDDVELMDYLCRRIRFADRAASPKPGLILLNLNMPKNDGRHAPTEFKANRNVPHIRVVVMTTSKAEEDIFRTYDLGAGSYVTKPVTFAALVDVIATIGKYWLEIVELPNGEVRGHG